MNIKIKNAWDMVDTVFKSTGSGSELVKLLAITQQESKEHEGMFNRYRDRPRGITILEEAKYFAVRRLVEALQSTEQPDVKSYSYTQKSVYMAYCLAHGSETSREMAILQAHHIADLQTVANLDYAQLIRGEITAN